MLDLDAATVRRARTLARQAGRPVVKIAKSHTTVSVERATLRLAGLGGADHEQVPWVNHLVDAVRAQVGIQDGVTTPVWDALARGEAPDLLTLAQKSASGAATFRIPDGKANTTAAKRARTAVARGIRAIDHQRAVRDRLIKRNGNPKRTPWIYLIVATGDIYEDIPQAQAAAREGADVIAVIRSTGLGGRIDTDLQLDLPQLVFQPDRLRIASSGLTTSETAKTIDADGWLHTGDIAKMDADGYFYIVDRKKDLIIASGYNIVPR